MKLKNRFVSRQYFIEWFTARDFRASVVCTLARFERLREQRNNNQMTFEEYIQQPIETRIKIVDSADWRTAPFWLERLKTAIDNYSPIGLGLLDKRLADEYWTIPEAKKLQTA